MTQARRSRLARLERIRAGKERRLRVVEHWPGDPAPAVAGPGELLVVLRRFGERPPPAPASPP